MLLEVDLQSKPDEVRLYLCKNNLERTTLCELHHIKDRKLTLNYGGIDQISFGVPYKIMRDGEMVNNPHMEQIRGDYLIRYEKGLKEVFFIITNIENSADGKEERRVQCQSLQYEWKNKIVRGYAGTKKLYDSLGSDGVINETLMVKTDWSVNYTDSSLDTKYRTFDESQRNLLEFVYYATERYGDVIPIVDTVNKQVSFYLDKNLGIFEGLEITYGKYLKSLTETENFDDVVTRLYIYGKDNISINRLNPTGADYIESFDFYMNGFERDANGNVISHSPYMDDDLCIAIEDYNALLETKDGEFQTLLSDKETLQGTLTTKNNELTTLETDLQIIEDDIDTAIANGSNLTTLNQQKSDKEAEIDSKKAEIASIQISSTVNTGVTASGNITFTIDSQNIVVAVVAGDTTSTVASKINTAFNNLYPTYKSTYSTNVATTDYYVSQAVEDTSVTFVDTDTTGVTITLSTSNKGVENKISTKDKDIAALRNEIAIENNFTAKQIIERNTFIKEAVWQDNNYTNVDDLYAEGKERLIRVSQPIVAYKVDAIDFTQALNTQKDWNKLKIGGIVTINYPNWNLSIKAKIITIEHDIDSNSIQLTIANHKDIKSGFLKIKDLLNRSVSTSTQIDMSKYKWDKSEENSSVIDDIVNSKWDATKNAVTGGKNENVSVDRHGITIVDESDPNKILRILSSVIAMSNDGGNTYKLGLDASGVVAENVYGKLGVFATLRANQIVVGDSGEIIDDGLINAVKPNTLYNKVKITSENGIQILDANNNETVQVGAIDLDNDGVDDEYGFKATHNDGSITALTQSGLIRRVNGVDKPYNYLVEVGSTESGNTTVGYFDDGGSRSSNGSPTNIGKVTIALPSDFKGKNFKISLSYKGGDPMYYCNLDGESFWVPDFQGKVYLEPINIDYTNATFDVEGWSYYFHNDGSGALYKKYHAIEFSYTAVV
jgi:hypothetical protein